MFVLASMRPGLASIRGGGIGFVGLMSAS